MMDFWKEIVIYQICSGSVSFAASSAIVTFVAKSGLVTPYRRLIFGLSISDLCQSFAILAGPWLVRSDVPQARWGIGNKHSCQLDGFLYVVGMTAVPMYTVCLCMYYVCKLKGRMSDSEFTRRIETKMHIGIIVVNLGLYLTALAMDTINPGFFGSLCSPASVPTGCKQNPQIFGECDPNIKPAADFFIIISIAIIPSLAIVAIVGCIAMIFWHVLVREKIFGRGSAAGSGDASHPATAPTAIARRNRHLRPIFSSDPDPNESYQVVSENSAPSDNNDAASCGFKDEESETMCREENETTPQIKDLDENFNYTSDDIEAFHLLKVSTDSTSTRTRPPNENGDTTNSESAVTADADASDNAPLTTLDASPIPTPIIPIKIKNDTKQSEDWSVCGGAKLNISQPFSFTSAEEPSSQHLRPSTRVGGTRTHNGASTNGNVNANTDIETLSYIYKKELLTQICCYVLAFCVTTMPFLIVNVRLVQGFQPSKNDLRSSAILYPLAGFFNIIVYTRWNVRSWRRRHPECSRLRAFWWVLKAGGDMPSEEEWNRRNHGRSRSTSSTPPSLQFMANEDASMSAIQFGIGAIHPQHNDHAHTDADADADANTLPHSVDFHGGEVMSSGKVMNGTDFSLHTSDFNDTRDESKSKWSHMNVKGGGGGGSGCSESPRSDGDGDAEAASNSTLDHPTQS